MSETPSEPTPEEAAANDAHTAVNEADQTWGEKIEGRLAAIEEKVGLVPAADTEEETK